MLKVVLKEILPEILQAMLPKGSTTSTAGTTEQEIRRTFDVSGKTIACPVSVPPVVHNYSVSRVVYM